MWRTLRLLVTVTIIADILDAYRDYRFWKELEIAARARAQTLHNMIEVMESGRE